MKEGAMKKLLVIMTAVLWVAGCQKRMGGPMFRDDVRFLEKVTKVIVLKSADGRAQVAVCPEYQGRIMTSTADGEEGLSFGWINREFITAGQINLKMSAYGGEDRFWLGPEGGQFSIFFKKGDPFDFDHWATPPPINSESYETESAEGDRVLLRHRMTLTNYSNTVFDLKLERDLRLLNAESAAADLGFKPDPGLNGVAFQSSNTITNGGKTAWKKETGLVSMWILGMFNPSPAVTVVVPFKRGPEAELGPVVRDTYFGKVPAERLIVKDGVMFFRCDGQRRSKIGLTPKRCIPLVGSYDALNRVLTLVRFSLPDKPALYVNSLWELQKDPFDGDAVNSYNDGSPGPGQKPLGPFYELESSSPGAELKPGESMTHVHLTCHFQGDESALDAIARKTLGVGLDEIKSVFGEK
jgi:hypothetical protein